MKNVIRKILIKDFLSSGKLKFYDGIFEDESINICVTDASVTARNQINEIIGFSEYLKNHTNTRDLRAITKAFSGHGDIFIVGGFLRDAFHKIPTKDIDLVTNLSFNELVKIFPDIKKIGQHFGVGQITLNSSYEIATFRKDIKCNGMGATEVVSGTFSDDWKRRDFTINAIYYNLKTGELIDPSERGLIDLIDRKITFIGSPKDRIEEDVLRLLRILKLHKKGFNISRKTLKAFREHFHLLCEFGNPERIREHLEDIVFVDK